MATKFTFKRIKKRERKKKERKKPRKRKTGFSNEK